MSDLVFDVSRIPPQLRESLLHGKAAAEIGWGSEGAFDRCVSFLRRHDVPERMVKGECATLHHEATGKWPGAGRSHALEFAAEAHTGAMIALVPTEADAQRMAMKGGEPPEEMHLTLAYLGDAAEWSTQERLLMASEVAKALGGQGPVRANAFALAYFNPGDNGKETALVYGVDGADVDRVHRMVRHAAGNTYGPKVPDQHTPFAAHVTAKYTDDLNEHRGLVDRLGPMTFDTVRLAFGGDHYDIPLQETVDLDALVASMGNYSPVTWRGPLAPIGSPTGDKRIFQPGALTYQTFPAPLRFQRKGMPGHEGAVVVGRILHAEEGQWQGWPYIVGHGDWFNPDIVPEVTEAMALVEGGVAGPSVDLDSFAASVKEYGGKALLSVHEGRVRGATLVSIPAFADLRLELQYPEAADEPVETVETVETGAASLPMDALVAATEWCAEDPNFAPPDDPVFAGTLAEFASVNATGWKGAPVAPRDAEFDADDAVSRIEHYAGIGTDAPDESKMRKMFLWVDPEGAPLDRAGYRLPWGDIIDGKPHLIYHAIYAAAALLEGGHGGLPNIPDSDKARLRTTISDIYAKLATEFGDPNIQASWDRAAEKAQKATKAEAMDIETFAIQGGFGSMPIAKGDPAWDKGAALRELDSWAGDDIGKYKRAFLYREDSADPKLKGSYKFPVARPINGTLTIIPAAVRNAAARVANANVSDKDGLRAAIETLMNRIHRMEAALMETGLAASGFDGIHPPKSAFAQKKLTRKTMMTVVPRDGYNEVYGHLADWESCHMGLQIGQPDVCIKPPRSRRGYKDFHISTQLTAEGEIVEVGKLTIDTYHGSTRRGITAAQVRAHYEHTGTEAAVGRVYEDEFGPAFFGVQVPDDNPALAQKIRRTPVSGHWHPIDGHLELVAALGVNRPAYPITAAATGETYMDESSSESVVLFDGDVQVGLIAGVSFSAEELAEQETGCGCDGSDSAREERIARLSGLDPLPTHEELRARRSRLAAL
jgi:2'-5' RNA ligase